MATALQYVQERHDVGINVGIRIFDAVAHARLSRQMTHCVELLVCEQILKLVAIGDIDFRETPALRTFDDLVQRDFVDVESARPEACQLQANIVVGVEVVNARTSCPAARSARNV